MRISAKRMTFRPEDGAELHGSITERDTDEYRAECHAELDRGGRYEWEPSEYCSFDSKEEAINWIEERAAARGFRRCLIDQ